MDYFGYVNEDQQEAGQGLAEISEPSPGLM